MGEADDFLNAVAEIETSLEPEALLDACLEVEQQLGRERKGGWAPRTIDLDLIHYESVCCETPRLNLPHPRIGERDFVAIPLGDLYPEYKIKGQTIKEVVDGLSVNELRKTDYELV
jgi:2-amino-4-hydroxy-6-hydroxymethyldihydropteridine diphosphokinase